jgi:hypothetical protein
MTNYQIKISGGTLADLVHEIAARTMSQAVVTAGALDPSVRIDAARLYPGLFAACKEALRPYVRGFHVCGCRPHCDLESQSTELGRAAAVTGSVSRYVLSLDIPLKEFAKDLEARMTRVVAGVIPLANWRKLLFPVIRDVIQPTLGRHLTWSPTCNRGEYLCTVGACTEYDPWATVEPRAASGPLQV